MLAEGRSMKEIAYILHISVRTVRFHKYGIMRELGITTNSELVQYAIKHAIASPFKGPNGTGQVTLLHSPVPTVESDSSQAVPRVKQWRGRSQHLPRRNQSCVLELLADINTCPFSQR